LKEIRVSLDVYSRARTLRELLEALGMADAPEGSHDRLEPRPNGRPWTSTRLCLDSGIEPTAPIESHIAALVPRAGSVRQIVDVEVVVSVAMFFSDPMASLRIPMGCLAELTQADWKLEFVSYPCGDDVDPVM
jgi:hypothetical protein